MGLFDRLFGKKKDTKEQSEEQEIAQVLEETSADESKEVAETAAVETQAEDVIESEVTPVSEEARQLDETKEAAEADFLGVMADYYAKKEAAKEALDRGETVEFEAVETKQEDVKEESVEPVNAPVETEEEKYNRSLKKTRTGFSARLNAFLANFRRVDEDFFEELEEMLILSDVGVNVATQLTEDLRYEAKLENAKKADDLKRVIIEKLVEIYEKDGVFNEQINFQDGLTVMLFVGVNGVGKTTSIGKLAYKYKNEGKKVMLVAADTFRAGAVAQLAEWGRRVDVPVVTGPEKADPASVVFDGMERAVAENVDVLLIDTAGRLQNKDNLMAELEKIGRIIKRVVPDAPHETLLALDASTGQNALSQAKEFSKITPLTGLILTKIDGTAKGGVVLAIRQELDIPVKFIGFGEKIDDIGEFDSEDFIRGLLEGII
ncbi:signal recognition particle-docking protein FtsY [Streptococcus infantarius subsp. infantarius]|uniref:signal recognition particle-docking protein FtsY n=1 Tax=Streptococcus infantarius TaxID=102684 RepID=UPI001BDA9ED5|nr:signal recognition particle-docking protein FtsY [Streptococcus infantarius]MBT0896856.1 signal recognition particle-docking protein FtsY [Streptococcus infantarius subsp. infantarius]MBT0899516.1 signal recognition particle-docking protein FtsY [Streptococcus infantarius subsp. infantarius]MBT1033157.1 signal recognition particle-docking protein FtsY [Streptococcus infantarius subsp. infantarius]MCO4607938.1 signal recognition particle-docking protein [Streptococcus infantarius subsp. infan